MSIIQTRLDALGEEAKLLLRAASTFGQAFTADGVTALLGIEAARVDVASWLQLLCDREVIFTRGSDSEREYVFRHALIRDAAYALLPEEARTQCHRLAAEWLLARGSSEAALLAAHFEQGGLFERAAEFHRSAALHALEAGALEAVIRAGERAVSCGARDHVLGDVASLLAEAHSWSGREEQAAQWAARARACLTPGTSSWWRASQVLALSELHVDVTRASAVIRSMLERTTGEPTDPHHVIALSMVASECFLLCHRDLGARLLSIFSAGVHEGAGPRALACVHSAHAVRAMYDGRLDAAVRHQEASLDALRKGGARLDIADALALLSFALFELGITDRAEQLALELRDLATQLGALPRYYNALGVLGLIYLRRGKYDEAERALEESAQGYERLMQPNNVATVFTYRALNMMAGGRTHEAAAFARRALDLAGGDPRVHAVALATAAMVDVLNEQASSARDHAEAAMQLVGQHRLFEHVNLIYLAHVHSLLASRDLDAARTAVAAADRWLDEQAAKIESPALRHSFLTRVLANAKLKELAGSLLGAAHVA